MSGEALTREEIEFLKQRELFVPAALDSLGWDSLDEVPELTRQLTYPLRPTLIRDYRNLAKEEIAAIASSFYGLPGVAHYIVLNPDAESSTSHPLLEIAKQLEDVLPLKHPVEHPMEKHQEAIARFGEPDGTLKIYDLETRDGTTGYREQAETSEMFDAHNDGLGYAGAVEAFILHADAPPLWGGYTYFSNMIALSLLLARLDAEAFDSLFLPDAITALRPRGKGAIRVTSPVLFMNEHGRPQNFFRVQTGEYRITWRENCPELDRARAFLMAHVQPFSAGTSFVHLDRKGSGCIARNHWVVHGRTPFINGDDRFNTRVLARKWFMSAPEHASYKHVPGMHIMERYASIYPERFGAERLIGDWHFDPVSGENVRIS
ncbi:TauD/TfdA family dioxygenase [Bradyrhizobium sp. BR13661]|uniref:TauD/TfdA family dioxygenase n=2 Tax=Pseudomonadota TaxID=1224 RepID=UPI00247668C3|nr:TauD/TfdA family dioxygenase [Bradyrhizobium sp. BR13661]MDH6260008.1 hypothetical protein [Bradyrhizobium sp. BR13661]